MDRLSFDAFGNRVNALGGTATAANQIRHQYVGEYQDQSTGLYQLRARWMNPQTGRFISMDLFEGVRSNPLTLNKYTYAHSDPVNAIDPSGYITLGGMMGSIGNMAIGALRSYVAFEIRSMVTNALLSPIINSATSSIVGNINVNVDLPAGNTFLSTILTTFANMCYITKGKKCYIKGVPVMSSGNEMWNTSSHIAGALLGYGNTIDDVPKPLGLLLIRRVPSHGRNWYNKYYPCNLRGIIKPIVGTMVCDEYPYASTWNGGSDNYEKGNVSLMMVPVSESSVQGNKIKQFYRKANILANMPFINLANPLVPSFYIDKKGKVSGL